MVKAAIAFDSHRFVKNLTSKGFTEQQAEALAEEQVHLLNANLVTNERLAATDERIEAGNANLSKRIEEVNANLSTRIVEAKFELIKWMAGMLVASFIAMSGMVFSLIKFL